jgi:hypothetical protein
MYCIIPRGVQVWNNKVLGLMAWIINMSIEKIEKCTKPLLGIGNHVMPLRQNPPTKLLINSSWRVKRDDVTVRENTLNLKVGQNIQVKLINNYSKK